MFHPIPVASGMAAKGHIEVATTGNLDCFLENFATNVFLLQVPVPESVKP